MYASLRCLSSACLVCPTLCYRSLCAGKTHTMSGTDIGEYAGRGLNYRALDDLFELNRSRGAEVSYDISVQLLEIYNEVGGGGGLGLTWAS